MSAVARTLAALRARCVRLEESIERNARALNKSEDFAERVGKVHGAGVPLEDLDIWDLGERRSQLSGLAHRLLEAQTILATRADEDHGQMLRSLVEEPEVVELSGGRAVPCYPITIPVAVQIYERQDIIARCIAGRLAAEGTTDYFRDRHRFEGVRTWQRAALMYEATLPPGSPFRLPKDTPMGARVLGRAIAWLDGSNRWDRQFWRTFAVASWGWRLLDKLVPGRWLARLTGIPSWWCWTVSVVDEVAIMRGHLAANDERAHNIPPLKHAGEAKNWTWSEFAAAVADALHQLPGQFIHDTSMVSMLTHTSITARRRKLEEDEREKKRRHDKSKPPPRASKFRTPVKR